MEKKDMFVVGICVVLIFLLLSSFNGPQPQPAQPGAPGAPAAEGPADSNNVTAPAAGTATREPVPPAGAVATPEPAVVPLPAELAATLDATNSQYAELEPVEPLTISHDGEAELLIAPSRGGILKVTLPQYKQRGGVAVMELGDADEPMLTLADAAGTWHFSEAIVEQRQPGKITYSRAVLGRSLVLRQTIQTKPEAPHSFACRFEIVNTGGNALSIEQLDLNCGTMTPLNTSKGFMGAGGYDQRIDVLPLEETSPKMYTIEKLAKQKDKMRLRLAAEPFAWLAVQNKYFCSLVSAEHPFQGCDLRATPMAANGADQLVSAYAHFPPFILDGGAKKVIEFECFLGPKKYGLLKKLGHNKEAIMQFDLFLFFHFSWMKWISLAIFNGMLALQGVFHNYGIAIIILTLIIRTLFWPITHKSTVWSKRLQKIQPLAKELREKYKDDPQKMQQKTFELYREHKINPLAGCLPMVVQIPVFFALFNVLRSATELRQAGFLWAHDLSVPDTIATIPGIDLGVNPLALLMGITMMMQQRMMPTSVDPSQQTMMLFMTVFFVFLLYGMPSGLTLYWTVNQMVSIFQYWVTHKLITEEPGAAAPPAPA